MRRSVVLFVILSVALAGPGHPSPGASPPPDGSPFTRAGLVPDAIEVAEKDEIVAFNTKSLKYHCRTCSAAKRCTRNCIDIRKGEAKKRGGVACRLCGGSCRR